MIRRLLVVRFFPRMTSLKTSPNSPEVLVFPCPSNEFSLCSFCILRCVCNQSRPVGAATVGTGLAVPLFSLKKRERERWRGRRKEKRKEERRWEGDKCHDHRLIVYRLNRDTSLMEEHEHRSDFAFFPLL